MLSPRFIPKSVFSTQSVVRSPLSVFYTDRLENVLILKVVVYLGEATAIRSGNGSFDRE